MTSSRRIALVHCLLVFSALSIVPVSSGARQFPPLAEEMAKTYGLDSLGEVEAVHFDGSPRNRRRTSVPHYLY